MPAVRGELTAGRSGLRRSRYTEQNLQAAYESYIEYGDVYGWLHTLVIVRRRKQKGSYDIIVISPQDDTSTLEEALKQTKRIEWDKAIIVPFAPQNVIKCLQKVCYHKRLEMAAYPCESFYLDLDRKEEFSDVSLPPDLTYKTITPENIELIESKWPHKYSDADWYFNLLLKAKSGHGLYKNGELVSWVFHNEAGNLGHMYTLEKHRRKGYAELLLNIMAKLLLSEDKHVVAYCVKGNENAANMYKKFGFRTFDHIAWVFIKPHQGAEEKNPK